MIKELTYADKLEELERLNWLRERLEKEIDELEKIAVPLEHPPLRSLSESESERSGGMQ